MPAADSARRPLRAAERATLLRWAAAELGFDQLTTRDVSWDHAESHVLASLPGTDDQPGTDDLCWADAQPVAFVKRHRQPRAFEQDRAALHKWAPSTAPQGGGCVPCTTSRSPTTTRSPWPTHSSGGSTTGPAGRRVTCPARRSPGSDDRFATSASAAPYVSRARPTTVRATACGTPARAWP